MTRRVVNLGVGRRPDTLPATAEGPKEPELCQWFALCDHLAVTTRPHPILGAVPICQRCDEKIERLGGSK